MQVLDLLLLFSRGEVQTCVPTPDLFCICFHMQILLMFLSRLFKWFSVDTWKHPLTSVLGVSGVKHSFMFQCRSMNEENTSGT